jgi:hypothetical protein
VTLAVCSALGTGAGLGLELLTVPEVRAADVVPTLLLAPLAVCVGGAAEAPPSFVSVGCGVLFVPV